MAPITQHQPTFVVADVRAGSVGVSMNQNVARGQGLIDACRIGVHDLWGFLSFVLCRFIFDFLGKLLTFVQGLFEQQPTDHRVSDNAPIALILFVVCAKFVAMLQAIGLFVRADKIRLINQRTTKNIAQPLAKHKIAIAAHDKDLCALP